MRTHLQRNKTKCNLFSNIVSNENIDRHNVHGQVEFVRARCNEKHAEYDKEAECLNENPSVMK